MVNDFRLNIKKNRVLKLERHSRSRSDLKEPRYYQDNRISLCQELCSRQGMKTPKMTKKCEFAFLVPHTWYCQYVPGTHQLPCGSPTPLDFCCSSRDYQGIIPWKRNEKWAEMARRTTQHSEKAPCEKKNVLRTSIQSKSAKIVSHPIKILTAHSISVLLYILGQYIQYSLCTVKVGYGIQHGKSIR